MKKFCKGCGKQKIPIEVDGTRYCEDCGSRIDYIYLMCPNNTPYNPERKKNEVKFQQEGNFFERMFGRKIMSYDSYDEIDVMAVHDGMYEDKKSKLCKCKKIEK